MHLLQEADRDQSYLFDWLSALCDAPFPGTFFSRRWQEKQLRLEKPKDEYDSSCRHILFRRQFARHTLPESGDRHYQPGQLVCDSFWVLSRAGLCSMKPHCCLPSGFLHRRSKMFFVKIKVPPIKGRVKRKDAPPLKNNPFLGWPLMDS